MRAYQSVAVTLNRKIRAPRHNAVNIVDIEGIASPASVNARRVCKPDRPQRHGDLTLIIIAAESLIMPPLSPFLIPAKARFQARQKIPAHDKSIDRRDFLGVCGRGDKCGIEKR